MLTIFQNIGLISLVSLLAVIAGIFEDLESDVASTSNPNSQVQLAPQTGHRHKLFNRAVSGEPLIVTCMLTIAGVLCVILNEFISYYFVCIIIATLLTVFCQLVLSISSYMGRITSQASYNQPLFMDVIYKHAPIMAVHTFVYVFSITVISLIMLMFLKSTQYLSITILNFLLGLTLGSVGSAIGDIHYGSEKLYQNYTFGMGVAVSNNGSIANKASLGATDSLDVAYFCSKFAAPLTGLAFGLIIFLSLWLFTLFSAQAGIIIGFIIVVLFILLNIILESTSRINYGKYKQ